MLAGSSSLRERKGEGGEGWGEKMEDRGDMDAEGEMEVDMNVVGVRGKL